MACAEYALQQEKEKNEKKAKDEEQRKQELITKEEMAVSLKKDAVSELIHESEKKESEQVLEQETAMQLISEASTKLNVSLKSNDLCGAKVAQAMLSTGNSKLHDTYNQLLRIREEKQKCQQKMARLAHSKRNSASLYDEPAAKKRN